jgi:predicted transglutaminase-like cysteine proteinase
MNAPLSKREETSARSEEKMRAYEHDLLTRAFSEEKALQLLRLYLTKGEHDKARAFLAKVSSMGQVSRSLRQFALKFSLHVRDYRDAYKHAEILCYEHDRYGEPLLQLAEIAYVLERYSLATGWLHEYIERHRRAAKAHELLALCYLRQRDFEKALDRFGELGDTSANFLIAQWLSEILEGGRRLRSQDWFGRKKRGLGRLESLDWKNRVLNSPLSFQARSLGEIANWINGCRYVTDERLFGEADHWQVPADLEQRRVGDCEDFSLWAWVQLLRLNYNARLVLGGLCSEESDHAWVCMYTGNGVKVLECTPTGYNMPLSARNAPEYLPMWSMDRSLIFYEHRL